MPNTIKFIDTVIKNIKPDKKRIMYWCEGCPGFGLRVSPSGTKTFVYKYNKGTKRVWVTIGKYPEWTIRRARGEYDKLYEAVRDYGRDPVEEKRREQRKIDSIPTVEEFLPVYLETGRKKGKLDLLKEQRLFERDVLPVIGHKRVNVVRPSDIDEIQLRILKRAEQKNKLRKEYARQGGRGAVYHAIAYVRQFFNLAIKKIDCVSDNPVNHIEKLGSISVCERVLSFTEIWQFWHGIEKVKTPPVTAKLLKFMLVTMQRGIEARNMRYAAMNIQDRIWHMPMQDTKNKSIHRVPLNNLALTLIDEVSLFTSASQYVFGATRAKSPPDILNADLLPYGESALRQVIKEKRHQFGITESFSPHDLRRTGATWISAMGLAPFYAELLLNHKEKNSDTARRVYIQYSYDNEKRKAMDVWECILTNIINSPTIEDIPNLDTMRTSVTNQYHL